MDLLSLFVLGPAVILTFLTKFMLFVHTSPAKKITWSNEGCPLCCLQRWGTKFNFSIILRCIRADFGKDICVFVFPFFSNLPTIDLVAMMLDIRLTGKESRFEGRGYWNIKSF